MEGRSVSSTLGFMVIFFDLLFRGSRLPYWAGNGLQHQSIGSFSILFGRVCTVLPNTISTSSKWLLEVLGQRPGSSAGGEGKEFHFPRDPMDEVTYWGAAACQFSHEFL